MSTNALFAILAACGFVLIGAALMLTNADRLEREDNAFAKDCNDRGGVAKFEYSVRQCIGAKPKEQPNVG